jgi:hypothetical protein
MAQQRPGTWPQLGDLAGACFTRVGWTRGAGCKDLAELLSLEPPLKAEVELAQWVVDQRIEALVSKSTLKLDLVATIVPHHVDLEQVTRVTAAVGSGPHSQLVAQVAGSVAAVLGLPGELATVCHTADEAGEQGELLERMASGPAELTTRVVIGSSARELTDHLDEGTLLVVGAPGGSWLHRQFFGPGHRLIVNAPGGVVVVRSAPRRCFHQVVSAAGIAVGPHLLVEEARRLISHPVVPVADGGILVGILRRRALRAARGRVPVSEVMDHAVAVGAGEPLAALDELTDFFAGAPVPVVDGESRLLGVIVA